MSGPVRIPADVDIPDRVLARLTARQAVILAVCAAVVYAGWWFGHRLAPAVPVWVYASGAVVVVAGGSLLAFARRDGIGVDMLLHAAVLFRLRPRHLLTDPTRPGALPGWVSRRARRTVGAREPRRGRIALPGHSLTGASGLGGGPGVVHLGSGGWAVMAATSTVPMALRHPDEQAGLIECFARLLHAQTGPLQIVVRTQPLDLTPALDELAGAAAGMTHPALAVAALGHRDWLAGLAARGGTTLLTRQVLVVLREPHPLGRPPGGRGGGQGSGVAAGAAARLAQRLLDLERALAPAEITVAPLTVAQIAAVLATSADPARPAPTHPSPLLAWRTR